MKKYLGRMDKKEVSNKRKNAFCLPKSDKERVL